MEPKRTFNVEPLRAVHKLISVLEFVLPKSFSSKDYSERDKAVSINSYTTVLRRPGVPHEVFATYWRDVHGPLCSRIPGLAWYVQNHFNREQDAHLWPAAENIPPFENYVLDGGVEIGFETLADQKEFNAACSILFADEQNMFAATVAYALPSGSTTLKDCISESNPNGDDGFDRIHVHIGSRSNDRESFSTFMNELAQSFASDPLLLKVRLHLPDPYDNAKPAPPAPNVEHTVSSERRLVAILELAFETPLKRRAFYESDRYRNTVEQQKKHIGHVSAFAVSGVYTYVRDKKLTVAGMRGSRPAQLIEKLGALNQIKDDVSHLMFSGTLRP